jgi:hypothetical protein
MAEKPPLKITNYLDVVSSWCFWAEPMWAELKERYAGRVAFDWKIALMDESGMPKTLGQLEWYYRRSSMLMRAPYALNPDWFEPGITEYLAPNAVAEAAKDLGITDDTVRVALATAGLREGRKTGQWDISAEIGAATCGIIDSNATGDRAVFAGFARIEPIEASIDAMLEDIDFYEQHAERYGTPPAA